MPAQAAVKAPSLARRLFFSATAVSAVVLLVIGIVLSSLYRNAVERAFDRRINVYLRNIVAEIASNPRAPTIEPETLGEPLFFIPASGWYWQITRLSEPKDRKAPRSRASKCRRSMAGCGRPTSWGRTTSACARSSVSSISARTAAFC
jgi:hypothetical protein